MKKGMTITGIIYAYIVLLTNITIALILPNHDNSQGLMWLIIFCVCWLVAVLLFLATMVLLVSYAVKNVKANAMILLKVNMIVKLSHVLAHLIMFVYGIFLFSLLFTIGLSLIVLFSSCTMVVLSGAIGGVAIYKCKHIYNSNVSLVLSIISQFCFVIDVVICIVAYCKAKKYYSKSQTDLPSDVA